MGILIAVIVITLVVAAIGAGVYVLIFRAKHKKEVMANSQMIGGGVPVYGPAPDQQTQPDFTNMAAANQPTSAPNQMMNDITGNAPVNDPLADMTQAPQAAPAQEEPQPSISRDFTTEPVSSETQNDSAPQAPVEESPATNNTFDLNQLGQQNESGGNLLDDTQVVAPISEMAKEDMSQTPDGDMADFSVPATAENEVPEQAEPTPLEPAEQIVTPEVPVTPEPVQPTQDFPTIEQSAPQSEPVSTQEPSPEPSFIPEPPVSSEVSAPTPPLPTENVAATPEEAGEEQDTSTKEMPI
jgi:hypothetical protein